VKKRKKELEEQKEGVLLEKVKAKESRISQLREKKLLQQSKRKNPVLLFEKTQQLKE